MTKKSTYRFTLLTIIRIFAALMLAFASPSSALAAVWTDQQDYSPGSVVTISGDNSDNAGYLPGETVNVNVTGPNDYTATCSGVADGNGAWSCQITLWDSLLAVGDYAYTATGQTSGVVQSGAFTDAQGAYSFDFSAADPGDIPTYPKVTPAQYGACPAPSGGTGRAADPLAEAIFGNPVNSVESLAPEDMILGQIVPFETEIKVNGSVAPENGRIRIVQDYLARTTNGGNFGYDTSFGLYCAFIDTADAGNASLAAGTKVESYSWTVLDPGTNNERIRATIIISGLVNPETVILETWVVLKNTISAGITGNVQSSIVSGQTCTNPGCTTGGNISVGNQTIPLLRVQEFFTSDADLTITKSDSPDPVLAGSQLTYSVQVTNNGPATANNIVVTDTLDANTSFVASSLGSACTPSGSNIVCNLGGLAPGQSTTFTITVNVSLTAPTGVTSGNTPATGTCTSGSADLCNQVTVRAITNDHNTANNSDSEPTNVLPLANLQIVKNTVGGDDTFSFAATGSGLPANFSISTSGGTGSQTYTNLVPGARTITEQNPLPAGWSFTNLTCVDPDSGTAVSGQTATVDLDSGETVVCTYTNAKGGSITIVKNTVGGNGTFEFTSATLSNFAITTSGGTGNQAFSGLAAGTYDVSETVPTGWDLTSATCSDGSNPTSIGLSAGENVTCTFTNTKRGTIIVEKQTDPDGAAGNFTFTGTAAGTISDGGQIVVNNLIPGTYTATENNPGPTFALTSITCNDANSSGDASTRTATFQLEAGETVKCTFTNTQQAGTLIVKKVVTNDHGGTKSASDFSFVVNGGSPVAFETDGQNELSVSAGVYNIIEPAVAGYTTTYNNCANVNVPAGGSATCTITNDDQPGTLIVKKIVINDNGGTLNAEAFSFSVNGGTAVAFEADGQNHLTVNAGTYSITEPAVAGYSTTYDGCSNVEILNGGSATCTITNDDNAGTLIVKKVVINDNGGTLEADDFSFSVNGDSPIDFEADGQNNLTVNAGTYNITEPAVAGYTTTYDTCSNVVIPNGGSATCTITNDDQPGTLIVKKVVMNDNGGTLEADDFSFSVNGGTAVAFEADGENSLTVNAGMYTITETAVAGYSTTYNNCSNVVITNGGTATCTITNNDVTAHLSLIKQVTNDNGGDANAMDWTLSASGPTPISGAGGAEGDVNAGIYTLSEAGGPSGYTAGAWVCVGGSQSGNQVTLANGESATCTIINNDVAPTLTLIKNVVNNNGGAAGPNDFGLSIGGNSATSGTPYTLDANTPYVINEASLIGYAFVSITGDAECPAVLGGSVTLDEGENITCTITNDDVAPTLTLIKTVTNDSGGDAVVADFPLFINGNPVTSGVANTLSANTLYTASETNLPGYTASVWGGDCAPDGTITLQPGDNKTCTITNNDVAPTLTLIKNVVNNNGGAAGPNDFGLSIGGNPATSGTPYTLDANTPYVINEAGLIGYAFVSITGDAECPAVLGGSVTLDEGENITCTITNDDIQPKLIVIKLVVNDNGGALEANDFTITVTGNGANPASFPGSETGTNVALNAGAYSVTEVELTGYTTSYSIDCTGTLAVGQTKTCTITNDDQPGTIIVEKQTSPDGLAGNFTFTGDAAGTIADGEQITVSGLSAGAYTSSEVVPAGWQLTSIVCSDGNSTGNLATQTATFNLENGETVKCVFTNDPLPTVTLIKTADPTTLPEPGGDFDFTVIITNTSPEPVTIDLFEDNQTLACDYLEGQVLNAGESVTCVYTISHTDAGSYNNTASVIVKDNEGNSASAMDEETVTVTDALPTVNLVKSVDDNEKPEPGGVFNYTLTITNNSVETVEITALTDTNALSAECLGLIGITLTPGQSVSCTYSVTHTDAGSYPNTASVTVEDNENNPASDSDTETVTVTDVLPTVDLVKSVDDNEKPEPGGVFNFTLTITNISVEDVTITALTDTQAGVTDFSACNALIGTSLNPGQSVSCTYSVTHTDAGSYPNTASVTVADDEGNPASDSDTKTVTVTDVAPQINVEKTANPTSVPETGGNVTFTFVVTNNSVESVSITELSDSVFGTLAGDADCKVNTILGVGASCTFDEIHFISDDYPGSHTNTFTAKAEDNEENVAMDADDATVAYTDVLPDISVSKTASPTTVPETGGNVLFTFVVTNNSTETATITGLSDDKFGTLAGDADCQLGTVLASGASCSFSAVFLVPAGDYPGSHVNTFTATVQDDDGNEDSASDDETVTYTDVLPDISVIKTANPTSVPETGANVTFTFTVANHGPEAAIISSLSDLVYGTLTGDADCQIDTVLASGASCEFSITRWVAGDFSGDDHYNVFTGKATDNDGNEDTATDDETVTFTDVLPDISVSKTASPTSVPETGGNVLFTFVVTNHNSEAVTLTSLTDSDFGNLNGQGTCATGGTIAGNGGTYTCSFTKWIAGDFESGIPHENTATAVASDDDGNSDTASDDAIVTFTDVTADIVIDKVTMDDTASGDGLNILIGESIKWRYTVTNAGNYPLSNISVTDSVVGVTPTYVSGDTNSNDKLDLTETWIYEASGTAITGNYSNTGTASGNFTDGAGNVESDSASDTSSYFGADPQLIINKVTVDGATASDGLNILTGEPIQWRYTITNTGNVLLSNVTVTDSVASVNIDCDGGTNTTTDHIVASLAVGASVTCVANGTAITGNYSNLGTASGRYTDSGGHTRTDAESDASSYFGANPQIDIVKTTVGTDSTIGDNVFVITGGAVTWRYVVTNTGNVALSGPVVTDTVAGVTPIFASVITGDADGLFEPGEVWLYTATGTNNTPAGMWYSNTGWASGSYTDSAGHTRTPTDSDTSRFYSGTPGAVTNSSLCDFGPNFRLVFTPDSRFYTSSYQAYKLSDSNPGQFFYNVFYTNPGSTSTVRMEIPYPFVTQGAMPVHVYGGLTVNDSGSGTPSPDNLMNCFVPGNTLAAYGFTITLGSYTDTNGDGRVGFGDVVFVNVPATSGFQYINIHLDYGLEKTDGWVKQGSNAITDQTKYPGRADIRDLTAHTFKAYANSTLIPGSTDTVYNQNEFKQVRGFGGLVYTWHGTLLEYVPLAGAKVRLYKGTTLTTANLLETMTADNDGWYLSTYVHKGKAATYTLALLDASGTTIIRTIQVIAGGSLKFGEGNFRLGGPTPNP